MKKIVLASTALLFALNIMIFGCGKKDAQQKTAEPGFIDYATGAEQVKIYQKTKANLDTINKAAQEHSEEYSK